MTGINGENTDLIEKFINPRKFFPESKNFPREFNDEFYKFMGILGKEIEEIEIKNSKHFAEVFHTVYKNTYNLYAHSEKIYQKLIPVFIIQKMISILDSVSSPFEERISEKIIEFLEEKTNFKKDKIIKFVPYFQLN